MNSCGWSFPSLAFPANVLTVSAMSCIPAPDASLTMGVIKPPGVATATEMSTEG